MVNVSTSNETEQKTIVPKKVDSKTTPIKKPTHIYLNDKCVTDLENLRVTDSTTVLYLHNNSIRQIENINAAVNLTSLYLQKNKITKIENLDGLKHLRKLYLGHNEISVVEGLENLTSLKELHIEKQRFGSDSLCFDPRSIAAITKTLEILNISNNNITSIYGLSLLRHIRILNASYNKLENIRDICDTLCNWFYLVEATFVGNPITKQHRYRENVIGNTFCLALLDSKQVSETTRCFIKRFEEEKLHNSSKHSINLADKIPDIPKHHPLPIQKAVSQSILKETKRCFDDSTLECDVNDIYLPWNAMPKTANKANKNLPSILKTQKKRTGNKATFSTTFPSFLL